MKKDMPILIRLIYSILLSYLSLSVANASITAAVNSHTVGFNEQVQLTLTVDGSMGAGVPDLSPLQQDFSILGTERRVSYTIVNGQSTTNSQWLITLKPNKAGFLTIPSITLGKDKSNALQIEVGKSPNLNNAESSGTQGVMLRAKTDITNAYVNQQVLYTVKLYNSKRLLDSDYQPPQVKDALILPIGDANRYPTTLDGIQYMVEEQKYAIYPEKSGKLTIQPPVFSGLVYDFEPKKVQVKAKASVLEIKPIPQVFNAKQWLPAKKVELTEQYEYAALQLAEGGTLIRTITLQATAVPAQLLPKLNFSSNDEVRVYPEKGSEKNVMHDGELVGTVEYKVTYLFNQAGQMKVPGVSLAWFNTQTNHNEVAKLFPKVIDVVPGDSNEPKRPQVNAPKLPKAALPNAPTANMQDNHYAWYLAMVFAMAWVITLLLWFKQKRPKVLAPKQEIPSLAVVKRACLSGDPRKARDALLSWSSSQWPGVAILNLSDIAHLVDEPQLKEQLDILSKALYQESSTALWQGEVLFEGIKSLKKSQTSKSKSDVLPLMNP